MPSGVSLDCLLIMIFARRVYTCSRDADFVIGPLDGIERITVVSDCSSKGFEHFADGGESKPWT